MKWSHHNRVLLGTFFFFLNLAVDPGVTAHNMLSFIFSAEVFIDRGLAQNSQESLYNCMRHTGYFDGQQQSDLLFLVVQAHLLQSISLSGIIVSRHATRDVNRGGESEGSEQKGGSWWSLLWWKLAEHPGWENQQEMFVFSFDFVHIFMCLFYCVLVCLLYVCIVCGCVCARVCLQSEVWIEPLIWSPGFWRGTLCGASKGHVWSQKEWINAVVINGDTHKNINVRIDTYTDGCWERRFCSLIYSPENNNKSSGKVRVHVYFFCVSECV